MPINTEKFKAPGFIFIVYMLAASLIIFIFRFILPGSEAPLFIYSGSWRLIQGALELFNLFPALILSALVIPFGIAAVYEENFQSFSEMFFKKLSVSVIISIIASVIYAAIFLLAYPAVKNTEENMRFTGELYKMSRTRMLEHRDNGEWNEAAQFLAICDRIWYDNEDLKNVKSEINRNIDEIRINKLIEEQEARKTMSVNSRTAAMSPILPGVQPATAAQAMNMAQVSFDKKNYFDAHWLAALAGRLALPGTPEVAASARLASEAWNEISSLAPNKWEEAKYRIFALKLDGYQAMNNEDWIRAYYIFKQLIKLDPDDPDAKNFLLKSEKGAEETAFFTDEMELALGEILTGALFSLPVKGIGADKEAGRSVLRFSSLTTQDDIAYGIGLEYMSFDQNSNLTANLQSRYAKILPFIDNNESKVLILTHALDREDENIRYDSEYLYGTKTPGGIMLDISFEDFLLLGDIRQGLSNMRMNELFEAVRIGSSTGYVHHIFQAEILNRLGTAMFFLPVCIFVIIIGWRYRARKKPRYIFGLMLLILPVVFNGFVFLYRSIINTLGIRLVLSAGFAGTITIYIAIVAAGLFVSLITLAAQHS